MNKSLRLFFAADLPEKVKEEIAEKLLPLIPKERWRKVLPENLHVTLQFLGYLPKDAVARLQQQTKQLEQFTAFEAELNSIGHFKGRVLWIGVGKGSEEFNLLNKKLQQAIGVHEERFHAHVTLARNRGASKQETGALVERLRCVGFSRKILVGRVLLMQSLLHKAGPKYSTVFSIKLTQSSAQSSAKEPLGQNSSAE